MKAATPQGELPSDGCWYVLRRRSHGVMLKSQPTMAIITTGTSKMSQFTCFSAVSAMSLWFKYQGYPKPRTISLQRSRELDREEVLE
ncbi:hypothetical protein OIU79_014545 [Salix purpurea]|uniref:Uncharacterized protein n=1 Tax=Salix purpurea TaxID=77065 RepID=A0A9Q0PRP7_SALPP|nr:hypothetical protein OIU79_014545 [Salix purpurea]